MNAERARIVFLDAATYGDVPLDGFSEKWDCSIYQVTNPDETSGRLSGHSIAITNKVVIDQKVLSSSEARDLQLIAVAATGTDIIDRDEAVRRGIKVCNVPGYATQSVAQFTLALILELATRAEKYLHAVKNGAWEKSPVFSLLSFPSIELSGRKLGIIGFGSIGQSLARMASALGMRVSIGSRAGARGPVPEGRVALDQVFCESDFISLHCPLIHETRNLINERSLALMKPTAFLINTARGALVDEAALIAALRDKRIAGAALDVITKEPPPPDHPIITAAKELDNLIVTPHTAWSARESRERLLHEVEENIAAFLNGNDRNRVA